MPDLIPVPTYQPMDPYHSIYDNIPINAITTNLQILSDELDRDSNAIDESGGSTGSLNNRLNKSINDDGTLKLIAVDTALHHVSEHVDGNGYVRMTDAERDKLTLIENEATNLSIAVANSPSTTLVWPNVASTISISDSDTIAWRYTAGQVYADTTFALSLIVIHNYDITPIKVSGANYKTTNINTAYVAGSLRVYVNGLRLTTDDSIGDHYYEESNPANGTFSLNSVLSSNDKIRIDFDQPLS